MKKAALQTTLGTNTAPFVVEIKGKEYTEMERILNEARTLLQSNTGLYNITTSLDEGTPEVEIVIDRFKTSYFNVTVDNVIKSDKKLSDRRICRKF